MSFNGITFGSGGTYISTGSGEAEKTKIAQLKRDDKTAALSAEQDKVARLQAENLALNAELSNVRSRVS